MVDGHISSWNPSSGQGTVQAGGQELPFDVIETEILNKEYVDLHVGRPVKVAPGQQHQGLEKLEAL